MSHMSHFATQQKLTHHCKSFILLLKINLSANAIGSISRGYLESDLLSFTCSIGTKLNHYQFFPLLSITASSSESPTVTPPIEG